LPANSTNNREPSSLPYNYSSKKGQRKLYVWVKQAGKMHGKFLSELFKIEPKYFTLLPVLGNAEKNFQERNSHILKIKNELEC